MTPISSLSTGILDQSLAAPATVPSHQKQDRLSEAAPAVDPAVVSRAAELAAAARPEVRLDEFTQPTKEVIQRAADQIKGYLSDSGRDLNLFVDDQAGYYVTTVVNPSSGEVVRQIPPDETLRIARNVQEMPGLQGLFVDRRA